MDGAWLPVIAEGANWVKKMLGPSEEILKLQVDELTEKVNQLTYGNTLLQKDVDGIVLALIEKLKSEQVITVTNTTIMPVQINVNSNNIGSSIERVSQAVAEIGDDSLTLSRIFFDGVDEEIAMMKAGIRGGSHNDL